MSGQGDDKLFSSLQSKLVQDFDVSFNVRQQFIITTEDKLRVTLHHHTECLTSKDRWWTPATLFITLLFVNATSTFHDWLGLPKETWHAISIVCTVVSGAWLLVTGLRAFNARTETSETLIAKIKQAGPILTRPPNSGDDHEKIWQDVFARIPTAKAFVRASAAAAHVLPTEGEYFVLGFSPDQKSPMDILGTATNRKLIESLLQEVTGKDWTLKLVMQYNLEAR